MWFNVSQTFKLLFQYCFTLLSIERIVYLKDKLNNVAQSFGWHRLPNVNDVFQKHQWDCLR